MNVLLLLDMAASAGGDRVAVQGGDVRLTYAELLAASARAAERFAGADVVAYVGTNDVAFPVALFGAAAAGVPFVPLNYRLSNEQLDDLLGRHGRAVVVATAPIAATLAERGHEVVAPDELTAPIAPDAPAPDVPEDAEAPALLLYTSGTTSAPKAAVLRHRHLTSYVIGSVEFASADDESAALVSVPPYHIAGVANLLSNLYMGRRLVYLAQFDAGAWLETVRGEGITNAMVVPTMLARICEAVGDAADAQAPTLRALSYGGARTPQTVLERTMALFPGVDLTNAYGLTETSSTIAVLDPDDHRAALDSDDPAVRARLTSAGKVLPSIEVEVRDDDGKPLPVGEVGEIFVRGEQVSGEYLGQAGGVDDEGWFATRDRGWLDDDGYLFIEGRGDDTIIRGGENIAPAEIEEVLLRHPAIAECAVVGVPDDEWGQRIAAAVVAREGAAVDVDEVKAFVRERLRGSKTPDTVAVVDELPYTETGKLLRRIVREQFADA